ncbi:energy transducer TonB [Pseudotenacibaculum sp. MALMAid0570]|uniref:energy transducer TonB family protein n=1 Tax=Pseudotenacibaculum sp. MALMAid0570 TaxID=3143938 RepID=UPI0032DE930C
MSVFDTKHKKKSAIITSVILVALLYLIFNFGMKYLDPPQEYGIAINYGTSNVGKGEPKVVKKIKATPQPPVKEEKVEEVVKEVPKETVKEEVLTEDRKDAPVIEKPKEEKKKVEPKKEVKKEKPKPKPEPKKPSKATTDAFKNLLQGDKSDGEPKGEGDDEKDGLKGDEKGDPKSSKYYGNPLQGDGDSNYNLAGRRALTKPKQQPDCQEEGTVVVSIEVDKNGKVIKAVPGVKGTTNSAPCLLKPAKEAALRTTWNAAPDAPAKQKGTIIYKFTLTK